jgi:hypothetical protein
MGLIGYGLCVNLIQRAEPRLGRKLVPPEQHLSIELIVRRLERGAAAVHDQVGVLRPRLFVLAVDVSNATFDEVAIHGALYLLFGNDDADARARRVFLLGVAEVLDAEQLAVA